MAYGDLVLVHGNSVGVVRQSPLGSAGDGVVYDERWLIDCLFEHPEALPLAAIDRATATRGFACTGALRARSDNSRNSLSVRLNITLAGSAAGAPRCNTRCSTARISPAASARSAMH
ncbi:MAG TPA: hypothetical protein VEB21_06380 [Terriglobales bacterium]|nr:hypothetical protein [Terriglobales bacterium]